MFEEIKSIVKMNRYVSCFTVFILCLLFSFSFVFADPVDDVLPEYEDQATSVYDDSNGNVVIVDNSAIGNAISSLADIISSGAISSSEVISVEPVDMNVTLQSVSVSTERISASDANGFKAVLLGLIGDYETIITDYEYRNNQNTYTTHSIDITPDYSWIWSTVIFGLVVYCFFKMVGGFLCNR